MEIMITIVAWGMMIGMTVGAMGGWLVLLIAWLNGQYTSGRFEAMKRPTTPRWRPLLRRKQAA